MVQRVHLLEGEHEELFVGVLLRSSHPMEVKTHVVGVVVVVGVVDGVVIVVGVVIVFGVVDGVVIVVGVVGVVVAMSVVVDFVVAVFCVFRVVLVSFVQLLFLLLLRKKYSR